MFRYWNSNIPNYTKPFDTETPTYPIGQNWNVSGINIETSTCPIARDLLIPKHQHTKLKILIKFNYTNDETFRYYRKANVTNRIRYLAEICPHLSYLFHNYRNVLKPTEIACCGHPFATRSICNDACFNFNNNHSEQHSLKQIPRRVTTSYSTFRI